MNPIRWGIMYFGFAMLGVDFSIEAFVGVLFLCVATEDW